MTDIEQLRRDRVKKKIATIPQSDLRNATFDLYREVEGVHRLEGLQFGLSLAASVGAITLLGAVGLLARAHNPNTMPLLARVMLGSAMIGSGTITWIASGVAWFNPRIRKRSNRVQTSLQNNPLKKEALKFLWDISEEDRPVLESLIVQH